MSGSNNLREYLRELFKSTFDEEALKTFCFDLRVNYEDLPAQGREGKIRELLVYMEQHGRILELIEKARERRPMAAWPEEGRPLPGSVPKPALAHEPETVEVPAGVFIMGSQPGGATPAYETPQARVELGVYRIGKYPVTNEQYAAFIKQTRQLAPKGIGWFGNAPPKDRLNHPVSAVSWYDAMAYCQWLTEQSGRLYRLPTEAEWEKAARGDDGRIYPWGNEWNGGRCNHSSSQTTPVTAFPEGSSPYGCLDMVGNVSEWTSTVWGKDWQQADFSYPYQPDDGREDLQEPAAVHRIYRGGAFDDKLNYLCCSARRWYVPVQPDRHRGFRIVLDV